MEFDIESAMVELPPRVLKTIQCDLPGCDGFRRQRDHDHPEWIRRQDRYYTAMHKRFPRDKKWARNAIRFRELVKELDAASH